MAEFGEDEMEEMQEAEEASEEQGIAFRRQKREIKAYQMDDHVYFVKKNVG